MSVGPLCAISGCEQSQQSSPLFDHLVGALLEKQRHFDAKCLGGLEVDYQFEFGRRLNGKVAGLLALEDAAA